jgi:C_GCAxxG_C_C family probable redox protein
VARPDDAEKRFREGVNCAQAVLSTYGPALGLDEATALRLASGLGGGVGRTGGTCGAALGACMVISLRWGPSERGKSREEVTAKVGDFVDRFEARCGSVECRTLLGRSIRTHEEHQKAREDGVFKTKCPHFVRQAAEILEEFL